MRKYKKVILMQDLANGQYFCQSFRQPISFITFCIFFLSSTVTQHKVPSAADTQCNTNSMYRSHSLGIFSARFLQF